MDSNNEMIIEKLSNNNKTFKRSFGGFDLTAIYFALIFGSYGAAQMTGQGWAGIPMLFLAAITFMLPTALAAFELGTVFPGEGGIFIWAQKAFGPLHGYISSWLSWVPVFFLLPLGASTIVSHLQFAFSTEFSLGINITIQCLLIVFFTIISSLKIEFSKRYTNIMFVVSFLTAVIVFICSFFKSGFANPIDSSIYSFNVFEHGAIYAAAILWLLGVEVPFNMGGEIKEHKRNAKTMLFWGSIILIIGYVLGIYGILKITPFSKVNSITGISEAVSTIYHPLGIIVALMICFAVSSQDITYQSSYSRLLLVSALEKKLPSFFGKISSNKIPVNAIILQCLLSIVVVIIFSSQQNLTVVFNLYIASLIVVWVTALFYIYFSLPVIRKKYKVKYDAQTSEIWKIPFGNFGLWSIVIFGIFFNCIALYTVFAFPAVKESDLSASLWIKYLILISFFVIIAGLTIYIISKRNELPYNVDEEVAKYEKQIAKKSN